MAKVFVKSWEKTGPVVLFLNGKRHVVPVGVEFETTNDIAILLKETGGVECVAQLDKPKPAPEPAAPEPVTEPEPVQDPAPADPSSGADDPVSQQ